MRLGFALEPGLGELSPSAGWVKPSVPKVVVIAKLLSPCRAVNPWGWASHLQVSPSGQGLQATLTGRLLKSLTGQLLSSEG